MLLILNEVAVLGRAWLCYLSLGCATLGMLVGGLRADSFREDNGGQMLGEGLYNYNAEPNQDQLADIIQNTCNFPFVMLQSNWTSDMYE